MPTTAATTVPVPRKSRWRWYLIGGFLIVFVATPLGYYFVANWMREGELAQIYRELDEEDPGWRWPDLVANYTLPPDEKNSAAQALKVHALLQKTPFTPAAKWDTASPHPLDWRNARLPDESVQILSAAFGRLDKKIMGEARMLKDMPHGRLPLENTDNPFAMKLNVQEIRSVVYLLQQDATLRANDPDDIDGAAQSCQALLNAAAAINDHPFLIAQLVRMAAQAIAVSAIERTLAQGVASETELQTLQGMLEREAAANLLHAAIRGERAASEQMIQSLRSGEVTWSNLAGGANGPEGIGDFFPGIFLKGHPEYLRLMNEAARHSKLAEAERLEALQKHEQKIRQATGYLTRQLMPSMLKTAQASQRTQAQLRSAAVAVAVERYRIRHGDWPGGAADLVQDGFFNAVPNDPYDGKPLRMKRTPTGVVIYSVGQEKIDDGGKLDRKSPMAPGTDLGFELWHPLLRGSPAPALEGQ